MSQLQILLTAAFLVALLLIVPSAQQGSTTPVTSKLTSYHAQFVAMMS